MKPVALTIAGSDSSGGAGLQADLAAFAAGGCAGTTVVTAVTAQSPRGVRAWEPVSVELVRAQLATVLDDLAPAAAKTGMLATAQIVRAVAAELRSRPPLPLVCDPVAVSTSGHELLGAGGLDVIREELFPLATVITPNAAEAAALSGLAVSDPDEAVAAGERLLDAGARAVLVTGGHFAGARGTDVLVTADGARRFEAPALEGVDVHGTGCALSAAIAAALARGRPLEAAIEEGKRFVVRWIHRGGAVG